METRLAKVSAAKAGGTAGKGVMTYKLTLPTSWVKAIGASDGQKVVLRFDGEKIEISPVQSLDEYREARLSLGHRLLEIRYYNRDTLCTVIVADQTAKDLRVENYTDQAIKTAFGINSVPTWADFEAFLEERCIPRQRSGLRQYLEALGLEEYDPLAIIRKTQGRMAEDEQWMEVEQL